MSDLNTLKENLSKTRNIGKICSDLKEVKTYISATINLYIDRMINLGFTEEQIFTLYSIFIEEPPAFKYRGLIDINGIPSKKLDYFRTDESNVREKIMFIDTFNFNIFSILTLVIKNYLINTVQPNDNNETFIKGIIEKMTKITGLNQTQLKDLFVSDCFVNMSNSEIMKFHINCLKDKSKKSRGECNGIKNCFVSELIYHTINGLYLLHRHTNAPITSTGAREANSDEIKNLFDVTAESMYPPFSKLELELITRHKLNPIIPYGSGGKLYGVPKDNILSKLAEKYKHFLISGASGGTEMLYNVFGSFINFDVELFCLTCIVNFCSNLDHSVFEVLCVCIGYGLKYDITMNEYKFVEELIKKRCNIEISLNPLNTTHLIDFFEKNKQQTGGKTHKKKWRKNTHKKYKTSKNRYTVRYK